jgi:hypothetical protein
MENFNGCAGFGIAGNFALHLEQAGEIEDFKDLEVADENGPKGIFPFYMPGAETPIGVFPLSSDTIKLPEDASLNVQAEPEVALECTLRYENGRVAAVDPERFAPYNDCSIRRPGAKKISEKKNWGAMSKGLGAKMLPVDTFAEGGTMDNWHIASFLRRSWATAISMENSRTGSSISSTPRQIRGRSNRYFPILSKRDTPRR